MKEELTMRPVTLSRIIDLCILLKCEGSSTINYVADRLRMSKRRAKEVISELGRMGLLKVDNSTLHSTSQTKNLIDIFESGDWMRFRNFFYEHHPLYRTFIEFIEPLTSEEGLTIDELLKEAKVIGLPVNRMSLEVLCKWGERLASIQRNAYSGTFYIISEGKPSIKVFQRSVLNWYESLNSRSGLGLRQVYVEIPRLRECVCEALNLSRETFDFLMRQMYSTNISRIELASAPTTTATKKSRFSIRTMSIDRKQEILSPKIDLEKYRRGLEFHRKVYFYLAIHDSLNS